MGVDPKIIRELQTAIRVAGVVDTAADGIFGSGTAKAALDTIRELVTQRTRLKQLADHMKYKLDQSGLIDGPALPENVIQFPENDAIH